MRNQRAVNPDLPPADSVTADPIQLELGPTKLAVLSLKVYVTLPDGS